MLFSEHTIKKFQDTVRAAFLSNDRVIAKRYIQALIERVDITDRHVKLVVRADAAARMMATPVAPDGALTAWEAVLATDHEWLPGLAGSKNFESEFVLDLDAYRKRKRIKELKLPPVVGHLAMAESFHTKLESGEVATRAALARQYGLTRARVTQLLDLLKLDKRIVDYARNLPAGTPERLVTEKSLRWLVRLAPAAQVHHAERQLAGFGAWTRVPHEGSHEGSPKLDRVAR